MVIESKIVSYFAASQSDLEESTRQLEYLIKGIQLGYQEKKYKVLGLGEDDCNLPIGGWVDPNTMRIIYLIPNIVLPVAIKSMAGDLFYPEDFLTDLLLKSKILIPLSTYYPKKIRARFKGGKVLTWTIDGFDLGFLTSSTVIDKIALIEQIRLKAVTE